jgi:hypothetical protein
MHYCNEFDINAYFCIVNKFKGDWLRSIQDI